MKSERRAEPFERRMRLFILLLAALALLLAVGIAGYALRNSNASQSAEESLGAAPGGAPQIYTENGLMGAKSSSGRVLLEPSFLELSLMSDSVFIARPESGADGCGLLSAEGEQLTPYFYDSFEKLEKDLWVGKRTENEQTEYHLYREDGTRRMNIAWDNFTYEDKLLTLGRGTGEFAYSYEDGQLIRESFRTQRNVGTKPLRMNFSGERLSAMPDSETLFGICAAAADYLSYLFVTNVPPDPGLLSAQDPASLRVGYRYENCSLKSAEIIRLKVLEGEGFPAYLLQIQARYERPAREDGNAGQTVETAMLLTLSRNAAGAYTYSGFTDLRAEAEGNAPSGG